MLYDPIIQKKLCLGRQLCELPERWNLLFNENAKAYRKAFSDRRKNYESKGSTWDTSGNNMCQGKKAELGVWYYLEHPLGCSPSLKRFPDNPSEIWSHSDLEPATGYNYPRAHVKSTTNYIAAHFGGLSWTLERTDHLLTSHDCDNDLIALVLFNDWEDNSYELYALIPWGLVREYMVEMSREELRKTKKALSWKKIEDNQDKINKELELWCNKWIK